MIKALLALLLTLPFHQVLAQEIALSFNDVAGPSGFKFKTEARSKKIVLQLKSLKVPESVFFIQASRLSDPEALSAVQQYSKSGQLIANHSYSYLDIDQTDPAKFISDLRKAHTLLKDKTGFTAWFRYPMLHEGKHARLRTDVKKYLEALEYENAYATVLAPDAIMNTLLTRANEEGKKIDFAKLKTLYVNLIWQSIEFYDQIAQKALGRSPKHVLLLHENDLTALFISDLVQHIRKQGWKIISPKTAYKDPISKEEPFNLVHQFGRVSALAKEKGYPGSYLLPFQDERVMETLLLENAIY